MNTPTKKFLVSGGALIVLVLVSCGLTGCNWFGGSDGSQSNSSVADTTAAEIPGLPPDPGEAGKATLGGIITNPKDVRDDIYRYIMINHRDSEKTREALFQYAKVVQNALLDANDKQKSVRHGEEMSRASECMNYTAGSVRGAITMVGDLQSVMMNTDERNQAYFTFSDQLGGEVFMATPDSQIVSTCAINPATLPN